MLNFAVGVEHLHIILSEIESESMFGKNKLNQSDVVSVVITHYFRRKFLPS